jgi:anti-sigma factor RsiW
VSQLQSGHLGDLGAALVDDQLSPDTREAALAHLESCPDCWREVEQQRRLKARLRLLTEPSLPMTLELRLSSLKPEPSGFAAAGVRTRDDPPGGALALALPGRHRVLSQRRGRLLAGAASLLLVGMGTGFAAAADVQPAPAGTSSQVLSTSGNSAVTSSVSLTDPAFAAMNASFVR